MRMLSRFSGPALALPAPMRPVDRLVRAVSLTLIAIVASAGLAQAQSPASPPAQVQPDDSELRPAEPDFKLINLPTSMLLPKWKLSFGLTHRFNSNLMNGSFLDQLEGLFGLDSGANIGLEFRFAPIRHVQAIFFRTNIERTIQFTGKFDLIRQGERMPLSISPLVAVEGTNNFRDNYQPAIGATVSRLFGKSLALYAAPMWVHETLDGRDTSFIGLGARVQIRNRTYLVAETAPRMSGYTPGEVMYAFGIEKRVGGHVFQLNFCNTSATTFGQIARGGFPDSLYLGFNLTRKFF
jgi:Membrane bound beta barrel domain (DUF5777)